MLKMTFLGSGDDQKLVRQWPRAGSSLVHHQQRGRTLGDNKAAWIVGRTN